MKGNAWICGLVLISSTGCGLGKGIVDKVSVNSTLEGDIAWVEMKADLKRDSGFQLPDAVLPLRDPKRPERILGEIAVGAYSIITRVNATEIVKFPVLDGRKLPNGLDIPIALAGNAIPLAVPVVNSNSRVYFALNGSQLMIGAAVAILKEDRLNYPVNAFFDFTISPALKGRGGFFLGQTQGLGVFALAEKPAAVTTTEVSLASAPTARAVSVNLSNASLLTAVRSAPAPRMEVRSQPVTQSALNQLTRASRSYEGQLQLD